jgi:hypothetical protein
MPDVHARLVAAVNARLEVEQDAFALGDTNDQDVIRHYEATLAILAEVALRRHTSCTDGWYSCSQATEEAGFPVDEVCSDDDREGQPCDCGLDRRRAAILHPLVTAYAVEVDETTTEGTTKP